jgi:hypothetical protein
MENEREVLDGSLEAVEGEGSTSIATLTRKTLLDVWRKSAKVSWEPIRIFRPVSWTPQYLGVCK